MNVILCDSEGSYVSMENCCTGQSQIAPTVIKSNDIYKIAKKLRYWDMGIFKILDFSSSFKIKIHKIIAIQYEIG